ncbi:lipopolysaccharide heptosyltransferase I [Chromobacterium phragmitis]|uniref:Lipopolysaccharide heptosyltransferase 1 n=1 Tax=Chromobacterium phragmitis TaxID=2202141 RepID=A0A344UP21_9NEIS|nr:lipopolysaccharide heptosyltransferase I [Chromobacterium phragmitis]AXE32629.1 lipopolysaccharide heptosyltransferase I [Chromobacterium phragmitis]AXE37019.1 lipopolysaccharide heptosyltransferase I [Chromobacterium phragmitis]
MNVLIVRTSSMGDLIHTWPAITELKTHYPNVRLTWLAEESFADIARLHPQVDEVLTLSWRSWRRRLWQPAAWRELKALKRKLRDTHFDLVLDSQGLLKSAIPARWAQAPLAGLDWPSARESLASLFYDKKHKVSRLLSAIDRNRLLFGLSFGYAPDGPPQFGIRRGERPSWMLSGRYAVLLHATSRASKEWPEANWVELGTQLSAHHDMVTVLPWGNDREKERAERLAARLPAAVVAPRMSLLEAAGLLGNACAVVGVDTGLVHLANALNVPVAAIYTDTDPQQTGVVETPWATNLGNIGQCPTVQAVLEALQSRRDWA